MEGIEMGWKEDRGVVAMEFGTVALERWLLTPGKERKIKFQVWEFPAR
jgi:hypothetical protein